MAPPFFGGGKTGAEVMKGINLEGSTAIITGASSGIGREMTRLLALAGCRVIMAVRKQASGELAARELREGFPSGVKAGELVVMQCDLASFEEIRTFAARLQTQYSQIDYLVLNAAVKATPKWYTKEGHELQMGANFLGHFHLVQLLLPTLQAQPGHVRIVCVTCKSEIDVSGGLRMTDLNFSKVHYDPYKAYKGSKIAMALFAKELAHRTANSNITVYAADPGTTGDTAINKWAGPLAAMYIFSKPFLKSLEQAVATPLFALVAPEASSGSKRRSSFRGSHGIVSGALLSDCKPSAGTKQINNPRLAARVWEEAEQLVERSVVNSHMANAGFEKTQTGETSKWVLDTFLRPLFDFLLRMFGLRKY